MATMAMFNLDCGDDDDSRRRTILSTQTAIFGDTRHRL
jgi:hypothetical protein